MYIYLVSRLLSFIRIKIVSKVRTRYNERMKSRFERVIQISDKFPLGERCLSHRL